MQPPMDQRLENYTISSNQRSLSKFHFEYFDRTFALLVCIHCQKVQTVSISNRIVTCQESRWLIWFLLYFWSVRVGIFPLSLELSIAPRIFPRSTVMNSSRYLWIWCRPLDSRTISFCQKRVRTKLRQRNISGIMTASKSKHVFFSRTSLVSPNSSCS